jgi:hypothetical protein
MSFCDWQEEDVRKAEQGLLLLGWKVDGRLTSDDALMLNDVALDALYKSERGELSSDLIDKLSERAFAIMEFQIMNIEERAMVTYSCYSKSENLKLMVPLIDQAILCYYRGYFTAALATLFIVIENYLRKLYGWKPGDKKPSFFELRQSVENLPPSIARDQVAGIIKIIYSYYDATEPPQFYFNRHGLLHGLREANLLDRMNSVRMFLLMDSLCEAEGIGRGLIMSDEYKQRHKMYSSCISLNEEKKFIYP